MRPRTVAAFLGVLFAGGIAAPLDVASPQGFVEQVARDTEAVLLLSDLPLEPAGLPRLPLAALP